MPKFIIVSLASWLGLVDGFGMYVGETDLLADTMVDTDFGLPPTLFFIHTISDVVVRVNLTELSSWPAVVSTSAVPMHVSLFGTKPKGLMSLIASATSPSGVLRFRVDALDWTAKSATVVIEGFAELYEVGASLNVRAPDPVPTGWALGVHQTHGGTMLMADEELGFFTQWTDAAIFAFRDDGPVEAVLTVQEGAMQLHGVFFNPSMTKAIGAAYYFDLSDLPIYDVDDVLSGDFTYIESISLWTDNSSYASLVHFVSWLDDRYAFAGTMQGLDGGVTTTSLTPAGVTVLGPSIFLLDVTAVTATRVVFPAAEISGVGIMNAISDCLVVGDLLFVAEEDTMNDAAPGTIGRGYVSVWAIDLQNLGAPLAFVHRFEPGVDLPSDMVIAHALYKTLDNTFVYTQDYLSNHLIKIDVASLSVVAQFGPADGLTNPHGAFIRGSTR